jgi:hypothetical protein
MAATTADVAEAELPAGVEAEDVPVLVAQVELARGPAVLRALSGEAVVGEDHLEQAFSGGVHVVVPVEAPRPDVCGLPGVDRPVVEEPVACLPAGAGVVDVPQVHDVHLAVARIVDAAAYLVGDRERGADTGAPVTDEDEPCVGSKGCRPGAVAGEGEEDAPEQVGGQCGEELGDPVVVESTPVARSFGELHTGRGPFLLACLQERQRQVAWEVEPAVLRRLLARRRLVLRSGAPS